MADNKSSEGKVTTLECMECGFREVFTERQFKFTDGLSCYVCSSPVQPVRTRAGAKINNRRMENTPTGGSNVKRISAGTMTVDVDVSEALKGLKAVQREAKKATAALKEFEEKQKLSVSSGTIIQFSKEEYDRLTAQLHGDDK